MKFLRFLTAALLFAQGARAGEAVFSPDGSMVYIPDAQTAKVYQLNLASSTSKTLDLTKSIPGAIQTITATGDRLILVTDQQIWSATFKGEKPQLLATASDTESQWRDAAWNPQDQSLYATLAKPTGTEFMRISKGKAHPVGCRRAEPYIGYAFEADGTFHFAVMGDAWLGSVLHNEDPETPDAFDLSGMRWAPLATLETYNGTPSQIGASSIAIGKSKVYMHVRRMGGSGWGYVVRCNPPPKLAEFEKEHPENDLLWRSKVSTAALTSIQILVDNGGISHLCATLDGSKVFYSGSNAEGEKSYYLIMDDGDPIQLSIQLPE